MSFSVRNSLPATNTQPAVDPIFRTAVFITRIHCFLWAFLDGKKATGNGSGKAWKSVNKSVRNVLFGWRPHLETAPDLFREGPSCFHIQKIIVISVKTPWCFQSKISNMLGNSHGAFTNPGQNYVEQGDHSTPPSREAAVQKRVSFQ